MVSDPPSGSMRDPQGDREEGQATSPPDEISSVEPPESPASSEISTTSATSSSRSWHLATSSSMKLNQVDADSIHAVLELSQGGCLPGDRVAIQVNVKHVKPIKNMNGIIVTFFRTCRVDTHPDLPLGPVTKGSKLEYEDYYPRSKTGLGGLSLSSAGSHKTFRQDLDQVFEPLIIDPKSLTAQIKTHIKIPDEIFPSITSVPGSMISFKYEIEALVDLRGRMAGQDYIRSQIGMINVPRGHGFGDPKKHGVDGSTGLVFPLASGFGCLDTSQMRREKFVISRTFGIVVGTRDSERIRLRKLGKQAALTPARSVVSPPTQERLPELLTPHSGPVQASRLSSPLAEHDEYFPPPGPSTTVTNDDNLPPPVWTADERPRDGLDEKTRLRNAEARLLPSAPPADDSLSRSDRLYLEPTAPPASDDMMYEQHGSLQPVTSASEHSLATIVPAYSARANNASSGIEATEESRAFDPYGSKEELEYRRLQQQASSPDDNMEVDSSAARKLEPSAPPEEDASFTEGQSLSNGIEESTASEEHFATVLDDGIEAEQALEVTDQLQRGSSQDPPQPSDDLEPSAPVLSDDDELYETHPAPAPLEAEHLPVYHK